MRTNVCKHCHESVGTTDPAVTTCGRCAGITAGCWVRSCEGITGQVVHARHSGGFIVELTYGTRQFSGSQLTVIEAPAANPAPTREPDCDDRPGPTPEVETATALVRLEQEEMTRLERVWIAGRLEILARCRQFDRIPLFH